MAAFAFRMISLAAFTLATPAIADDLWLGLYQHDVTIGGPTFETGADLKGGWISNRIDRFAVIGRPAPHVLISKSLSGGTNYIAAGLNWTLGSTIYVRPGIGLALNDGPSRAYRHGYRVDLGSRVTFEPELAVGWRVNRRFAVEASWIHLSHAQLFSHQNPGINSLGLRMLVRLR
jgi:hypothetical protein